MRALDILPTHLRERIGSQKVVLLYVIREDENLIPLEASEVNQITSEQYDSIMNDLTA